MLKLVEKSKEYESALDRIALEGARRMLEVALEAEVEQYVASHRGERDESGRALVVRNGRAQTRNVTVGSGTFRVDAPRVNDKRVVEGERQRFTSAILPPYMRRSPKVEEVVPVLYLRGLSTGDFLPALRSLLGDGVSGLSATNIARLTEVFCDEQTAFRKRSLADDTYVYIWADGIHFNVRLDDDRLCTLVLIGVTPEGKKELIAVEDGYRESTESWASLLRDLTKRGLKAPALAVGDGALGFWAAVRDVWPQTKQQKCCVHKTANVLDKLPKRLQPKAKRMLHEAIYAETRDDAEHAVADFRDEFEPKYKKAVETLTKDTGRLFTFFDFPAQHWRHIRSTNVIESAFATVRLRQRVTKGAGSRKKALAMAFKLLDMAQRRWRRIDSPKALQLVIKKEAVVDGVAAKNNFKPRKDAA